MAKVNDGGPAFPMPFFAAAYNSTGQEQSMLVPHPDDHPHGMSLRDWYAGMAMQAILKMYSTVPSDSSMCEIAEFAYTQADAMLAERKEQDGGGRPEEKSPKVSDLKPPA